ncbi:MAG: transposase [Rhodospirillales bacterium]|nr:transposase [Rhodospirillales bacterium]
MLGEQVGQQDRLFYEFNLDDRVPGDPLLRRLDAVLDLNWLRTERSPFYSHTGRPSIDPELMIRSERRLCHEVELNLAYRWFCRRGLVDAVPEHSPTNPDRKPKAMSPIDPTAAWTSLKFTLLMSAPLPQI